MWDDSSKPIIASHGAVASWASQAVASYSEDSRTVVAPDNII